MMEVNTLKKKNKKKDKVADKSRPRLTEQNQGRCRVE